MDLKHNKETCRQFILLKEEKIQRRNRMDILKLIELTQGIPNIPEDR
jgi:hypothetical protein